MTTIQIDPGGGSGDSSVMGDFAIADEISKWLSWQFIAKSVNKTKLMSCTVIKFRYTKIMPKSFVFICQMELGLELKSLWTGFFFFFSHLHEYPSGHSSFELD